MKAELNEASLDEFKEVNSPTTCPIAGSTQGDGHRYDAHGPAAHQVLLIVGTVLERVVDADAEGQDKHQGKDDEVDGGESGVQHCGRA